MQTILMYRGNNNQHVNVAIIPAEVLNIAAILPEIRAHFLKDMLMMWGGGLSPQPKWGLPHEEIKALVPEIHFLQSGKRVSIQYTHPLRNPNERQYHIEYLPNLTLIEV